MCTTQSSAEGVVKKAVPHASWNPRYHSQIHVVHKSIYMEYISLILRASITLLRFV